MALISRKPYCNWCKNRSSGSYGYPLDYGWYCCKCGEEIAKLHPDKIRWSESEGLGFVTEKQRCPDKRFFKPIYTREEVCRHNNHK